ncbi:hypothetical protein [Rhodococcoides kyotonense]|uniref:ABC transporter permease n=1 Tax=Rhodococcoides kyotonense TaxID=398843 RepID=A0A239I2I0_9NOCA|nr:hypothetical protein [Rhodococcus kyotonensis]SNS87870.1 hypothetical protein SAMN05421642_106181 [Rhodococcus kyotonensis]
MTLLTAEIRKITTLKFWWALALPPVVVGIFASAIASAISESAGDLDIEGGFAIFGLYSSLGAAMVFAAIFGSVNGGTEFRHDTITTSFLTARGRDVVILGKMLVTALFALGYGLAVEIGSIACLLLFSPSTFALNAHVVGTLAAGLFAVVLWALLGVGLGLLFGSPTWPSIIVVAWFPMGEIMLVSILAGLGISNASVLTPVASTLATVTVGDTDDVPFLMPWPWAPIVLVLWAAGIAAAGWWRTRQRDVA